MFSKGIIDADAPGLESYDRRCRNVDEQGERQVSHLGDVEHVDDGIIRRLAFPYSNERDGPQHNDHQVNDWNMSKGGTGHGEAKRGQEEERKRTSVDCKHDDRNHQDNLTLVRTQNPSPPDDDAISNDVLNQDSADQFTGDACG